MLPKVNHAVGKCVVYAKNKARTILLRTLPKTTQNEFFSY